MIECPACQDKQFLIVDVDATGVLRIERCDMCSALTLTDYDVERWPEAQAALAKERAKTVTDNNAKEKPP